MELPSIVVTYGGQGLRVADVQCLLKMSSTMEGEGLARPDLEVAEAVATAMEAIIAASASGREGFKWVGGFERPNSGSLVLEEMLSMGIKGEDWLFRSLSADLNLKAVMDEDRIEAVDEVEGRGSDGRGGESGEPEAVKDGRKET